MFSQVGITIPIVFSILITTPVANAYKVVVVDPGHCCTWAGTDGYGGPGGINESVRTMEIGFQLALLLTTDLEYMTYMTRWDESCLDPNNWGHDLSMRAEYANRNGPNADDNWIPQWDEVDAFVSIHLNAFEEDPDIDYTKTLYRYSPGSPLASEMSDNIVEFIDGFSVYVPGEGISFIYDATNAGIICDTGKLVLNELNPGIPGCLTEVLMYSNYYGYQAMKDELFENECAYGMYVAFDEFFEAGVGDPVDVTVKNHYPNGTSGGTVMVSGVTYDSPLEFVMYEGDNITLTAISPQWGQGPLGKAWFTHWSDGGGSVPRRISSRARGDLHRLLRIPCPG